VHLLEKGILTLSRCTVQREKFQINVLILILGVFYMFRTSCVHRQEDRLLSIKHSLPRARLLTEMHEKHTIKNCLYKWSS